MKSTKSPYEKRRQTKSISSKKNDFLHLNSQRIPVVSRPHFQKQELFNSTPSVDPFSIVIPLPHEISQLTSSHESEQKVSNDENPFECLASFYFPEHVQLNEKFEDEATISDNDCISMDMQTKNIGIQEAEEEFNTHTESASVVQQEISVQNHDFSNISEIVNNVPQLVKILQTKSQKKIFLEERK